METRKGTREMKSLLRRYISSDSKTRDSVIELIPDPNRVVGWYMGKNKKKEKEKEK